MVMSSGSRSGRSGSRKRLMGLVMLVSAVVMADLWGPAQWAVLRLHLMVDPIIRQAPRGVGCRFAALGVSPAAGRQLGPRHPQLQPQHRGLRRRERPGLPGRGHHPQRLLAYLNGYPGHQSRTVCVGQPSAEQKQTYRVVRDIYHATIARCVPGARTADIYRFANDAFHEAGFDGNVALAGHGAWWHLQDMAPVTDGAPRLLSPLMSTDEMLVAG